MKNNEKSTKIQIPTQAWLTTNIIMDIDKALINTPEISLKEYVENQKKLTNVWNGNANMQIYNLGTLFMMAYAFLVIPKESIEKNKLNISSKEFEVYLNKMEKPININSNNHEKNQNIIRHIRNSIAHANFDIISEKDEILFLDKNGKDELTFKGYIKINDFAYFLSNYFKAYYKCYFEN